MSVFGARGPSQNKAIFNSLCSALDLPSPETASCDIISFGVFVELFFLRAPTPQPTTTTRWPSSPPLLSLFALPLCPSPSFPPNLPFRRARPLSFRPCPSLKTSPPSKSPLPQVSSLWFHSPSFPPPPTPLFSISAASAPKTSAFATIVSSTPAHHHPTVFLPQLTSYVLCLFFSCPNACCVQRFLLVTDECVFPFLLFFVNVAPYKTHLVHFFLPHVKYDSHYVPAWTYNLNNPPNKKTMQEAIQDITQVVQDYPRTTIIESKQVESDLGKGYYSTFRPVISFHSSFALVYPLIKENTFL